MPRRTFTAVGTLLGRRFDPRRTQARFELIDLLSRRGRLAGTVGGTASARRRRRWTVSLFVADWDTCSFWLESRRRAATTFARYCAAIQRRGRATRGGRRGPCVRGTFERRMRTWRKHRDSGRTMPRSRPVSAIADTPMHGTSERTASQIPFVRSDVPCRRIEGQYRVGDRETGRDLGIVRPESRCFRQVRMRRSKVPQRKGRVAHSGVRVRIIRIAAQYLAKHCRRSRRRPILRAGVPVGDEERYCPATSRRAEAVPPTVRQAPPGD